MKKYIVLFLLFAGLKGFAQDNISPAPVYKGLLFIKNATVHVGNGQVLENTTIQVNNGKIEKIGANLPIPADDVKVFDATGKHVYPGLILSNTNIGLREIGSQVKGSNDYNEIGELNPNVRSIVAYNADSKIINTLRSNGILFANIAPQGSLLAGSSSVVQFDAWNWEDAVYNMDDGMHFYMPSLLVRPNRFRQNAGPDSDPLKEALDRIETVKNFFRDAKAYSAHTGDRTATNLKLASAKKLFSKEQRLFIHCNTVKEMLVAIDFVKEFGFNVTVVGGSESFQIASLLKQNNISVILQQLFSLPTSDDDDIDQPFKTPAVLQKAGVLFALTDEDGQTTGRNLMFNAGQSVAYGLSKEEALQAITLNAAKILGIADKSGSVEVGKDANFIISNGDILDMRTSVVTKAFIQGRDVDLNDKHKELNDKYKKKYGIK
ncbi:amidohydrolase family protein [Ferruginibacter sp. HRS2-29]|uniref:amidohydrolase family protein n=1 Tax=Ferruginibacter sp. HRS2-29 TaxID=2487334 RepID=UPI0020CE8858|nr:amidohydrolase family protein [Ferruginibacter sp. HRS2-29]MCP9751885.1 amidohydrolase [Ferruginibacter sp. HRS2-29]